MNQKAYVACNLNCLIETEGLLKVTGSHVTVKVLRWNGARQRRCYYRPL